MIIKDDRQSSSEYLSYGYMVVGLDTFMSGWGEATNGKSWAGWVCKEEDINECQSWVESRSDMKHVRLVDSSYKPSGGKNDHFHVYIYRGQGRS